MKKIVLFIPAILVLIAIVSCEKYGLNITGNSCKNAVWSTDSLVTDQQQMAGQTPLFETGDGMISILITKTFTSFCPGDSAEINFNGFWDDRAPDPVFVGVQIYYENKFLQSMKVNWSIDNQTGHAFCHGKFKVPDKSSTQEINLTVSYVYDYHGNTTESFAFFKKYFLSLDLTFGYFKI